ncbi:DNA-binding transcriptional regulator, AcrR family [Frankia canadensis]|uniref:DNA-binding transcriptional regulator, AcrR family n=1 Tax=Frankia canadensis TaxID=1836972 RepID=A0A2I2KPT7_9ACTN|nr:TetR/AcrR family transcriptional regulator [Frankia canadensis]SNQ47670.1 DNA-binding transcriptional regulator, AcrR family [Frankia canadensis]SOU54960.1 DNA-binding transcriptional regulator, AcrR family [Frankia canadensis]
MATHGRGAVTRTSRPRDRRAQILLAASGLFYRSGYPNVSTEEIAASVGITAGALYRHFRSKEELLARTLSESFDRAAVVTGRGGADLTQVVGDLAAISARRRELGVLWTRESRYLSSAVRAPMRKHFFLFLDRLVDAIAADRPEVGRRHAEVLAWCTLAVLTSPSYHDVAMSEDAAAALLTGLALAVCRTQVPTERGRDAGSGGGSAPGLPPGNRREALLVAAARMFAERGYQGVTTEEIGAAVGVSSAALYRHFATKADLLVTIVTRATTAMQLAMSGSLARAGTPEAGLTNAAGAYLDFVMSHPDLVTVLVTESPSLPEDHRGRVRTITQTYAGEWLRLLRAVRPELDRATALYRVHAVLTMVNDVARTAPLREVTGLVGLVHTACMGILDDSALMP